MPQKRNIPIKCERCGGDGFATKHDLKVGKGRFCSYKCVHQTNRKITECPRCGKINEYKLSAFSNKEGLRYCSKTCAYASRNKIPISERVFKYIIKGENETDCWKWTGAKTFNGYGRIRSECGKKTLTVSRIIYEIFNGPILNKVCVLHSCDNPQCSNPKHLFLGTMKENTHDMIAKGRHNFTSQKKYFTKEEKLIAHRLSDKKYRENKKIKLEQNKRSVICQQSRT